MITTIRAHLTWATEVLIKAGIPGAARDAARLMAHVLDETVSRVTALDDRDMEPAARETYARMIAERIARKPVSRIIGQRSFWKLDFDISDATLDPRPDTETLVEAALSAPFVRVLDLGTGSGCILLSLLHDCAGATGLGTDLSEAALDTAAGNARRHRLTGRAQFLASDWYRMVTGRFDLIVSNPPYIAEAEMAALEPEVRDHDPHLALTPGGDGLDAYRAIASGARAHLVPGGRILLEIGPTQAAAVAALLRAAGLTEVDCLPDIDGRDRVIVGVAPLE